MYLIDTNIIIYSSKPEFAYLRPLVLDTDNSVSIISKVETLGFRRITPEEILYFNSIFNLLKNYSVNNAVIDRAISLRQMIRIPLGDSLIAATALEYELELITRNTSDFEDIPELVVTNPMR